MPKLKENTKEEVIKKIVDEVSFSISSAIAEAYELGYNEGLKRGYCNRIANSPAETKEEEQRLSGAEVLKKFVESEEKVLTLAYNKKLLNGIKNLLCYHQPRGKYSNIIVAKRGNEIVLVKT